MEKRIQKVEENLQKLLAITKRYDLGEEYERIQDRIRDREWGLMVMVTGEGNFGKSSLINALAGKEIAPVSIIPKTFKVDIYKHTSNNQEYARLRRPGQRVGIDMSLDKAQALCEEEERRIHESLRTDTKHHPRIIEAVYFRTDLSFGPELCLVDTPGLAQMLLDGATPPERLVRGLDITYCVDEIWTMWYHRADVVLWCFPANKLESEETDRVLSLLPSRHDREIVPVLTKVDKIPQDRLREREDRFQHLYGNLVAKKEGRKLFPTVAGGNSLRLGEGIEPLRMHLLSLAPKARDWKLQTTEQFVTEMSRDLETVLRESADQAVNNLRTIADTADVIALEAIRRTKGTIELVQQGAENHVESKIQDLDDFCKTLYNHLEPQRKTRTNEELKLEAEQAFRNYFYQEKLDEMLNTSLDNVGRDIHNYANAACATKHLRRVRIGLSGKVSWFFFKMQMKIPKPNLQTRLSLPKVPFPGTGCLLLLPILGFGLWATSFLLIRMLIFFMVLFR